MEQSEEASVERKLVSCFPTFDSDIDTLMRGELRLHQDIAHIFSFIHILLDIKQLQGSIVLKSALAMVVR